MERLGIWGIGWYTPDTSPDPEDYHISEMNVVEPNPRKMAGSMCYFWWQWEVREVYAILPSVTISRLTSWCGIGWNRQLTMKFLVCMFTRYSSHSCYNSWFHNWITNRYARYIAVPMSIPEILSTLIYIHPMPIWYDVGPPSYVAV